MASLASVGDASNHLTKTVYEADLISVDILMSEPDLLVVGSLFFAGSSSAIRRYSRCSLDRLRMNACLAGRPLDRSICCTVSEPNACDRGKSGSPI